ncbi:ankyrin repeat domain-containing protein, partial [Rhodopirellula bahusiensis]
SMLGGEYMAQLLFDHHANPDASDARGNTPLHVASQRGEFAIVKLMKKHNASALVTNNQLYTPIHEAAANGHSGLTRWLLAQEQAVNPSKIDPSFAGRIQRVAERHGQNETAAAIVEHLDNPDESWAVPTL